jgi:hypothetical protein
MMSNKEEVLRRLVEIEGRTEALFDKLDKTGRHLGDDKILLRYLDSLAAALEKANQIIKE